MLDPSFCPVILPPVSSPRPPPLIYLFLSLLTTHIFRFSALALNCSVITDSGLFLLPLFLVPCVDNSRVWLWKKPHSLLNPQSLY